MSGLHRARAAAGNHQNASTGEGPCQSCNARVFTRPSLHIVPTHDGNDLRSGLCINPNQSRDRVVMQRLEGALGILCYRIDAKQLEATIDRNIVAAREGVRIVQCKDVIELFGDIELFTQRIERETGIHLSLSG